MQTAASWGKLAGYWAGESGGVKVAGMVNEREEMKDPQWVAHSAASLADQMADKWAESWAASMEFESVAAMAVSWVGNSAPVMVCLSVLGMVDTKADN